MLESILPTLSVCRHWPLAASQILTVRSSDADASRAESGEKATDWTESLWPLSVCRYWPLAASRILTVGSSDTDFSSEEPREEAAGRSGWLPPLCVKNH